METSRKIEHVPCCTSTSHAFHYMAEPCSQIHSFSLLTLHSSLYLKLNLMWVSGPSSLLFLFLSISLTPQTLMQAPQQSVFHSSLFFSVSLCPFCFFIKFSHLHWTQFKFPRPLKSKNKLTYPYLSGSTSASLTVLFFVSIGLRKCCTILFILVINSVHLLQDLSYH